MRKPHRFLFLLGTKISAKSPSEVFEPELNVSGWKWITPRTLGTFLASIVGAGSANKLRRSRGSSLVMFLVPCGFVPSNKILLPLNTGNTWRPCAPLIPVPSRSPPLPQAQEALPCCVQWLTLPVLLGPCFSSPERLVLFLFFCVCLPRAVFNSDSAQHFNIEGQIPAVGMEGIWLFLSVPCSTYSSVTTRILRC